MYDKFNNNYSSENAWFAIEYCSLGILLVIKQHYVEW